MTDKKAIKDDKIEEMQFEQALAELEQIVQRIDSGEENLAQAVESFERGNKLKKRCQELLDKAKLKIEKVVSADGATDKADLQL